MSNSKCLWQCPEDWGQWGLWPAAGLHARNRWRLPVLLTGAVKIIEAFADRTTIEQDFHDVKEVWGAGQQQVRNIWCNVAVYHLNLWIHSLVELWCWNRSHDELCDRSLSPWDDATRRPSHADHRKALRRHFLLSKLMCDFFAFSPAHRIGVDWITQPRQIVRATWTHHAVKNADYTKYTIHIT